VISLLDVNVLVALAWPNHVHHASARKWFRAHRESGWATCPTTENGFIRVSSNVRVIPEAKSPLDAALLLRDLIALKGHVFWPEEASILDDRRVSLEKIHTYRKITDAHLLSLALRHEGCLATFDRGILNLAPEGMSKEAVRVIPFEIY
jgi:toxin-antitoxin system PIN domain toxin